MEQLIYCHRELFMNVTQNAESDIDLIRRPDYLMSDISSPLTSLVDRYSGYYTVYFHGDGESFSCILLILFALLCFAILFYVKILWEGRKQFRS